MEGWLDQVTRWVLDAGPLRFDLLVRLVTAAVLGGLIGLEREVNGKPAGLRTNLLICVGAALVSDLSLHFAEFVVHEQIRADPARIAAQIVTGMGFLGAGTIIQARGSVTGLTTAATLWVVAAIGMAVGSGAYVEAVGTTVLVLVALVPLAWVEDRIAVRRRRRLVSVEVDSDDRGAALEELRELVSGPGGTLTLSEARGGAGEPVRLVVEVRASEKTFASIQSALLESDRVRSMVMVD